MSKPLDQAIASSGDTGQSSTPAIVVRNAEGIEASPEPTQQTPEPATTHAVSETVHESALSRQESSMPLEAPRPPHTSAESSFIPSSIDYNLRISFERSSSPTFAEDLSVRLHKPESYEEIEEVAEKHAKKLFAESIGTRDLQFAYGNCLIVSNSGTITRLPLRSRQDWREVNKSIVGYWNSHTHEKLRLCISRQYLASQERPTEGKSLAEAKSLEIHDLMEQTWEKKPYIPHNVLEKSISDEVIYYIIKENPPKNMSQDAQDALIHRVKAEGRILLAMCVHVELRMECLKKLLDNGCQDSDLPLDEGSLCHKACRKKFSTLLQTQGGYRAAHFYEGEHKSLHSHSVVPLHFCSRAHGKDELDREVTEACGDDPKDSSTRKNANKGDAWCGSGAHSNVYCVKLNANHHSLSMVSNDL